MRHWIMGGLVALLSAAAACGSSDDSGGGGAAGSGGGNPGGTGGAAQTPPSGAALDPKCGGSSAGGTAQDCADCMTTKCDSAYQACLGAGYKTGNYSGGACQTYMDCVTACDCSDSACYEGCSDKIGKDMSDPCLSCLVNNLGSCEMANCAAECGISSGLGGAGGGSGAGCAALSACCAALGADSPLKTSCDSVLAANNDTACSTTYDAWKAAGNCP